MRFLRIAAILAALVLLDQSVAGARAAAIATVRFIDGGLTVQPPRQRPERGKVSQPLYTAYFLQTRAGQRASLGFTDGTRLHINQRTDLVLRSPLHTVVRRGEVSEVDTPGSRHTVETPNAAAGAIGTQFDVSIAAPQAPASGYGSTATPGQSFPAGTTTVSVTQGIVVVSNQFGRVQVHRGEWTHVRPGQAPTRPTRHNAQADIAWTRGMPP